MKGPKTIALVVSGFVVLATGFAFADTALSPQNVSVSEETTTSGSEPTTTTQATTTTTENEVEHEAEHARSTVGCPEGFSGNHGQFVSSVAQTHPEDHSQVTEAAHSQCGKPDHDAEAEHKHGTDDADDDTEDDGEHHRSGPSGSSNSGSDHSGRGGHDDGGDDK